jgi:adenylyltransferase/sulfurtransferase
MVMAVRPGAGPCLRCIFPGAPDPGELPTCETQGVLNTAVTWVADFRSPRPSKLLVGDAGAESRLHALDIWKGSVVTGDVNRRKD